LIGKVRATKLFPRVVPGGVAPAETVSDRARRVAAIGQKPIGQKQWQRVRDTNPMNMKSPLFAYCEEWVHRNSGSERRER